jgi:hypothetical protein
MPTKQVPQGAFSPDAVNAVLKGEFTLISASGAIDPRSEGRSMITKAGVAALTLAAPNLGDDGLYKRIISNTANAHTITATGLYVDGAGHVNLATFAAQIGASIDLMAFAGKWVVIRVQGVTMS